MKRILHQQKKNANSWPCRTKLMTSSHSLQNLLVVVLPDPFPRLRVWRNSTKTQQSGYAPRSEPDAKMEKVVPKMAYRRLRCGVIQVS